MELLWYYSFSHSSMVQWKMAKSLKGQWLFLVPLIGGMWYIITRLAVYTTYISLIYCQLGDYISPIPPIKGTRKQPLKRYRSYWRYKKLHVFLTSQAMELWEEPGSRQWFSGRVPTWSPPFHEWVPQKCIRVFPKIMGFPQKSSHLFIGFSINFSPSILGIPWFLWNTHTLTEEGFIKIQHVSGSKNP